VLCLRRRIYDSDREAFRDSVRDFLDRQVKPHLELHLEGNAMPRKLWLEAGKQGLLELEVPERFGGSEARDYRFNAVLTEELAKVNVSLASCIGTGAERRARRMRPTAWRPRVHERIPRRPSLAGRSGDESLGRVQRNHERDHRSRSRSIGVKPMMVGSFTCR
jgi:Acyl-CoA dehydrogenase, N-terminal domain